MMGIEAILEYDSARRAINEIKKPLGELLPSCIYAPYHEKTSGNCIRLMHRYALWEKYSGNEFSHYFEMDEPECREPCDACKKALAIFDELKPARKRFGVAKTRLSRIARDYVR